MSNTLFKMRILGRLIANAVNEWRREVWKRDLDSYMCCEGIDCGCCGITVRESWSQTTKRGE